MNYHHIFRNYYFQCELCNIEEFSFTEELSGGKSSMKKKHSIFRDIKKTLKFCTFQTFDG